MSDETVVPHVTVVNITCKIRVNNVDPWVRRVYRTLRTGDVKLSRLDANLICAGICMGEPNFGDTTWAAE